MNNDPVKKIGILGSSGSIGRQTLGVIRKHKDMFSVELLACKGNASLLAEQIAEFKPKTAVCARPVHYSGETNIYNDLSALADPSLYEGCDIVINGIGGMDGLIPTLAILDSPAELATANKESIVSAGKLITQTAKKRGKNIIPVDSEHSAVYQCLEEKDNILRLILTASGGAFRDYPKERLAAAKAKDALNHPTWIMGDKVTIDSATLFNKCMEIIEAKNLFGINDVGVVIHRQSIVHALVEFKDGSLKASLSHPDMRLPIQYALTGGKRLSSGINTLDFAKLGALTFEEPDLDRFPCLGIAEKISSDYKGCVACAADEILVKLYMKDMIGFYDIPELIEKALLRFGDGEITSAGQALGINKEVKEYTLECSRKTGR